MTEHTARQLPYYSPGPESPEPLAYPDELSITVIPDCLGFSVFSLACSYFSPPYQESQP